MKITKIIPSHRFRRDIKKINKKHYPVFKIEHDVKILKAQNVDILKRRLDDHPLHGNYKGYRDLHVDHDLLIIYQVNNNVLDLVRCGSHDQLFK